LLHHATLIVSLRMQSGRTAELGQVGVFPDKRSPPASPMANASASRCQRARWRVSRA
jgi:hypothetical protein